MLLLEGSLRRIAPAMASLALAAQSQLAPDVHEARLRNGIRVLVVERPGNGMVRAAFCFRGGSADTGGLPPAAARLLAETVFGELRPEDVEDRPELEALLDRADHLQEALRIEALRRSRSPGPSAGSEDELALRAGLQQALARIAALTTPADQPDLLDQFGAVRRHVGAGPDALTFSLDLPTAAFGEWARLEVRRLGTPRLIRLPRIRHRLEAGSVADDLAERLLVENALPGQPYGRALQPGGAAGVLRGDLAAYARTALAPGRMAILLAGDLRAAEVLPVLEATFGALPSSDPAERAEPAIEPGSGLRSGPRRVQVKVAGRPKLWIGWPIPSLAHPDRIPLDLLARLLGRRSGGQGLAFAPYLGAAARTGLPGGRMENLFVVEAAPEEGRGLAECEQEVQRTLLRMQEGSLSAASFEGALRRLELAALEDQADLARLVEVMGAAWSQAGDWRAAFPDLRALRQEGPVAISRVARSYLRPERATVVLLETDLAGDPGDEGQAELLRLLRAQAMARLGDPVKAEALTLQAMEQLRMLSRQQREQVLKALKPAGKP